MRSPHFNMPVDPIFKIFPDFIKPISRTCRHASFRCLRCLTFRGFQKWYFWKRFWDLTCILSNNSAEKSQKGLRSSLRVQKRTNMGVQGSQMGTTDHKIKPQGPAKYWKQDQNSTKGGKMEPQVLPWSPMQETDNTVPKSVSKARS